MRRALRCAALALALAAPTACRDSLVDTYPFPDGPVTLTHPPLPLSSATDFIPMGDPNVVPKDHGGFRLLYAYRFPASTPVFAVRDGVIFRVRHGIREVPPIPDAPMDDWGRPYDDWSIRLKVSDEVIANYAHVSALHPDIEGRVGDVPTDERDRDVGIEVRGGDIIGYVDPHAAMDFSVTDVGLNLSFLNRSRYPEMYLYAGDVTAYYEGVLLQDLLAITRRTAPPWGGKIDYDVRGRIAGNWFLENTTSFNQWSRQLAIVYDPIEAERIFVSDGSPMRDVPGSEDPGRPDTWWVKGNAPLPEDVGVAEGLVAYELTYAGNTDSNPAVLAVMLVEMVEEGRIRVEITKGVTAADVSGFTSAAKTYVR